MKVLFVDIDTLRPDHMSCYGYERKTTLNIDEIARKGVRFDNYYCSDAPCLPSRSSLMSGMFGIKNGAVGHGGTAADRYRTGAERSFTDYVDDNNFTNIFRRGGMYTASISSFPERHSSWWFNAGFNEVYNCGKKGMEVGDETVAYALKWLEDNKERKDWFLHVHLWDPHTPFRTPEVFGNPFENEPLKACWITPSVLEGHKKLASPHGANEINMYDDREFPQWPRHPGRVDDEKGLKKVFDGYDCGVAYADKCVGQIADKLRSLGIYEDIMIIITADHGENLGELGLYAEHATADQPCCNIPLIIKGPGIKEGHTDSELHYSLDLVPTMSGIVGVEACSNWDGISFARTLTSGEKKGRDSLVISQMAHVCQRSARFGDWLYIRTYHDGFHLFDDEMLYNIKEDPYEQQDLKDRYPELCAKGAKIILDWHDAAMKDSLSTIDPLWTVLKEGGPFHTIGYFESYLERLEQTGRKEVAEQLREKYKSKEGHNTYSAGY